MRLLLVKKEFRYVIGLKDTKKMRSLCIFLPKLSAYRKAFVENEYIYFLINNNKLLEKYNEISEIVSNSIKKNLIVIWYLIKTYLRTKPKSYNGKINTTF